MKLRRILVPTDFSRASLEAVPAATELATVFGAEIVLLSVIEPAPYNLPDLFLPSVAGGPALEEEIDRMARERLERLAAEVRRGRERVSSRVETGIPAQEIVRVAESLPADLIVVATHGRTGLSHAFMGSVAEKVVRAAPCPVMTIRSGGRAQAVARKAREITSEVGT